MRRTAAAACLLLALVALAGCTGNTDRDSNLDGLPDRYCLRGWTVEVVTEEGPRAYTATCDPMLEDTNGDGLSDFYKWAFGLDPSIADTDGDGLTDCQEVRHTNRTQCEDPRFAGPFDGGYRTNPRHWDTDGDGLSDGMEVNGFIILLATGEERFVTTDPLRVDTDGDGLSDGNEVRLGTDPTDANTAGDLCADGSDAVPQFGQRYGMDVHAVTWAEAGHSGEVSVRFIFVIHDANLAVPATGGYAVQHGQEARPPPSGSSVAPGSCLFSPLHPWVNLDVVAVVLNSAGDPRVVDFTSSVLGTAPRLYWNVQEGGLRIVDDDAETAVGTAGRVLLTGKDGAVELEPWVAVPTTVAIPEGRAHWRHAPAP